MGGLPPFASGFSSDAKLRMGRSLILRSFAARAVASCAVLSVAACSQSYSPDTYASSAVQQASKVDQGVIIGRRSVDVTPPGTTGAIAGAAAGGIAGSQVGNGVTQAFGTLGGGLVGGVVGSAVERGSGQTVAFEYVVRKGGGEMVSVTQQDNPPLADRRQGAGHRRRAGSHRTRLHRDARPGAARAEHPGCRPGASAGDTGPAR